RGTLGVRHATLTTCALSLYFRYCIGLGNPYRIADPGFAVKYDLKQACPHGHDRSPIPVIGMPIAAILDRHPRIKVLKDIEKGLFINWIGLDKPLDPSDRHRKRELPVRRQQTDHTAGTVHPQPGVFGKIKAYKPVTAEGRFIDKCLFR